MAFSEGVGEFRKEWIAVVVRSEWVDDLEERSFNEDGIGRHVS